MAEGCEEVGMTDVQFKAYVRELLACLERAVEGDDMKGEIDGLIKRLKAALED